MKFVKWVTLTPTEKERLGIADRESAREVSPTGIVAAHRTMVLLPDGTECTVDYLRCGARAHKFAFSAPDFCQRLWCQEQLSGGVVAVEEKARELASVAFRLAQQDEQKEMRRRTPLPGTKVTIDEGSLKRGTAEAQAGFYAVCLRYANGRLTPVGTLCETPERVCRQLERERKTFPLHGEQRLVVGICCRYARRWQEARFVALPPGLRESSQAEEAEAGENATNG